MKPNFFIVGAPKCGTTALAQYLSEHPNVFISAIKEPHYFANDLPKYRAVETLQDYLALFNISNDRHISIGEASVFYLLSNVAIKNIKKFNPEAKLIVMLRNPTEMVPSLHSQLLYSRDETTKNFAKAWKQIPRRKEGKDIPKKCRDEKLLQYDQVAKYGKQLERLFTHFPRDNVMVIFYEDFSRKPKFVYQQVLNFLKLPDYQKTKFPVINSNKINKSSILAQFTQKTPETLVRIALKVKKIVGLKKLGILDILRNINQSEKPRTLLDDRLKQEIIDCYREDIIKLSTLTGQDLSAWLHIS